ncbi:MAG: OFA family MFS transporter [Desulfobacteraceae bacterium]|nr:OFA family MFS transporter [Desulfobacteraceae bacterium]MDH3573299.1 OFA family MFS transporter [Desulfobacteraceae bacterium]MDH3835735.1 OFA family MFS transporter [Desulfobacteraceae bacterium]MDH3875244.1 OFA family MFS transporter [Desulfobacteraceae bacterium]MDH3881492.1 OFA family MFS transporter [Desulfobacteraceae bacterium]
MPKYAKGYNQPVDAIPGRGWAVILAGTTINLCLGCLYAWSVWLKYLTDDVYMKAHGWAGALSAEQASNPKSMCILIFALLMIPGGKIQDKYGPTVAGSISAVCMGIGMLIAGTAHSYAGILWGFGVGGGIAMGIGYAAPVPATRRWVGPHQVGVMIGITVAGYGGAAFYVAPLIKWLIVSYSLSASFIVLGVAYLVVIGIAAQVLAWPEDGYVPPQPPETAATKAAAASVTDWTAGEMMGTWQFYALVVLFCLNTQAGLLIIGHAAKIVKPFLEQGFILVAAGGFTNAAGRVGTGKYSDIIGRDKAYMINAFVAALCFFALPAIIAAKSLFMAFTACMLAYWVYGGGLALMPSYTADFYGPKNLGFNYGLVFMGWGFGAFMPKLAGHIKDITGSYDQAFYIAGILLLVAVALAFVTKKPQKRGA